MFLSIKVRTSTEGARGREGRVAAEEGIVVASFSLICVGRMWERDFWVCGGGGGWFLGGSWLRFGEEWSRNEKVFGRSVRVFLAKIGADFGRKEVLSPSSLPLASERSFPVCSAPRESEEIKEI